MSCSSNCFIVLLSLFIAIFSFFFVQLKDNVRIGTWEGKKHPDFILTQDYVLESNEIFVKTNDWFESQGTRCHGWLFLPTELSEDPELIIIMSHGFGGQKDMGLDKFAKTFVSDGGFGVYVFDYRNFGGSEGFIRNLVDPKAHIEDIHAAINHITKRFPNSKIALWGTSFSGGHTTVVASEYYEKHNNNKLVGVVSQVAHMDGKKASKRNIFGRGILDVSKMIIAGIIDKILYRTLNTPVYIRMYGAKELSIMHLSEEELKLYYEKHPSIYLGDWKNYCPARIALETNKYSPIETMEKIKVPILFIAAEKDSLTPIDDIEKAFNIVKKNNPQTEFLKFDGKSHFGVYDDESRKVSTERVIKFLSQQLKK